MNNLVWKVKKFEDLNASELYAIIKARIDVFVVEQDTPYPDCDDYDQKALHLWAEQDGIVLAYCRIFDQGVKYDETSIGRVLTTELGRGKGLGRQLVSFAVDIIENRLKTTSVRISAQDYLLDFYGSFGFLPTDKKYLEDNLPHTEMFRI